jgi:magnesium transporter
MNFEFMPELKWHYGYHLVWVIIIAVGVCMLFYFRRKKWL